jgi:hypothetical protein
MGMNIKHFSFSLSELSVVFVAILTVANEDVVIISLDYACHYILLSLRHFLNTYEFILINCSIFHNKFDLFEKCNVVKRVAFNGNNVGKLADRLRL